MFQIDEDLSIHLTRGDVALFSVMAEINGESFLFQPGDVIRFNVYAKKNCDDVVIRKDFAAETETDKIDIFLTKEETKIGKIISNPTDYWYEVVLNPVTNPQTIIGYDDDGAKLFRLYPEGNDGEEIKKEDIPTVDGDFSDTSERPLQNHVITRRFNELEKEVDKALEKITSKEIVPITLAEMEELLLLGTWKEDTVYLIIDQADPLEVSNTALNTANYAQSVAVNAKNTADIANATANTADNKANALQVALSNLKEAKMQKGTYVGTGEKTFTLNFDISPSIVMLFSSSFLTMFIRGYGSISYKINLQDMNSSSIIVENWNGGSTVVTDWGHRITWGENSLTIENYTTDYTRFNSSAGTYNYIAIGGGEE